MHPDHVYGLLEADGSPAFPRAIVHVAAEDEAYWLGVANEAKASGVQKQIHAWARAATEPYRRAERLRTYQAGAEAIAGVTIVAAHGHTPGHSAILISQGTDAVLFWGDTVHSPSVQLPAPGVTIAIDSDETA